VARLTAELGVREAALVAGAYESLVS